MNFTSFINSLKHVMFKGFSDYEIEQIIKCLDARHSYYPKDSAIFLAGDEINCVGLVLSGRIRTQREDISGNLVFIDEISEGSMFGEAFVCAATEQIPISVWSVTNADVMFINYKRIINVCPSACSFHSKLISNIMRDMASKLIKLNRKIEILRKSGIREKLMAYFEGYGGAEFTIPFNRSQLAEYIGVNRSAMSRELGRMRLDGILDFNGNSFKLLRDLR